MASTTAKKAGKRAKKETDFCGLDPAMMMKLINRIPRNPTTGKVDLIDITKYMEEHPTEMSEFMAEYSKIENEKPKLDLSKYNFNALATSIVHESFWVVQLEHMRYDDRAGDSVGPDEVNSTVGVKPVFMIYCYDEQGGYRITNECTGLPDSKAVLETIQRAIAEPIIPLKPCLPWFLLVSIKLTPHAETLKPFLDSIPEPFHWRFETPQEAEGVHDGVHALNEQGVKDSMALAEKSKVTGNQAFVRKDRDVALKAYGEALGHVVDVLSQKPDPEKEKKAIRLRAICHANRAATHMLAGTGLNPQKALADGKAAEIIDPSYAKAYIRQAAASQALGNMHDAQDAIARALRHKDLENDVGLVDRLVELMTGGKGLSDDEDTFKNWYLDVNANDAKGSARLNGIQGEWKRRCAAQLEKWN